MVNRRSFLLGSSALALAPLLTACGGNGEKVQIRALNQSIPPQLLREFEPGLTIRPAATLKELLELLQRWQRETEPISGRWDWLPFVNRGTPPLADLVTLGDSWLAIAIRANLIQPLELATLPHWPQLPPRWQALARRDRTGFPTSDPNAPLWGAPYRWGTTMIAYREDVFQDLGWRPEDWRDLWRPELRDRLSMVDQPREVIGLTLKKLGESYNSWDLAAIPNLETELAALAPQVRYYSNHQYLHPLAIKETWAAVGWSTDILPALQNYPQFRAVVPSSGTALWADLWVAPQGHRLDARAQDWIDFCWQGRSAQNISLFTQGAAPSLLNIPRDQWPPDLQTNAMQLPATAILNRSEFLDPLPKAAQLQYDTLWRKLRSPQPL